MATRADSPEPRPRTPARGRVLAVRAGMRAERASLLGVGRAPGRRVGRLEPATDGRPSGDDTARDAPAARQAEAGERLPGPRASMTREPQPEAAELGEPSTAERAALALGQLADALGSVASSVRALTHALDVLAAVVSTTEDPI